MLKFRVGNRTINIAQLIVLPFFWGIAGFMLWGLVPTLIPEIKERDVVGILIGTSVCLFVILIVSFATYMLAVCGRCKRFFTLEFVKYGVFRCTFCGYERKYSSVDDW